MEATKYWKISPEDWGNDSEGWNIQWERCLKERKIAMGWDKVGDLSGLSLEQIKERLYKHYKTYRQPNYRARLTRDAKQLFDFKNIEIGDIVVANKGQKEIAGIAKVVGKYYFNPHVGFGHTLPVKWIDTDGRKIKRQMNWLQTVISLTKQEAQELGVLKISKTIQDYERGIKEGAKFSKQVVKSRTFQQVFRELTLENYEEMCAVCDVDDPSLLIAGHIVPVKEDPDIATDLSNGICLCVLHDVAFEKGFFAISDQYIILVPDWFKTKSDVLDSMISKLKGKKIRLPVQKPPKKAYVRRHRERHGFSKI